MQIRLSLMTCTALIGTSLLALGNANAETASEVDKI